MTPLEAHALATQHNTQHPPDEALYQYIQRQIAEAAACGFFSLYNPLSDYRGRISTDLMRSVFDRLRGEGFLVETALNLSSLPKEVVRWEQPPLPVHSSPVQEFIGTLNAVGKQELGYALDSLLAGKTLAEACGAGSMSSSGTESLPPRGPLCVEATHLLCAQCPGFRFKFVINGPDVKYLALQFCTADGRYALEVPLPIGLIDSPAETQVRESLLRIARGMDCLSDDTLLKQAWRSMRGKTLAEAVQREEIAD